MTSFSEISIMGYSVWNVNVNIETEFNESNSHIIEIEFDRKDENKTIPHIMLF